MVEPFLESTLMIVIGLAITAISGAIIGHFRTKSKCLQSMSEHIEVLSKRSFRIEKAIIILARMIDEQTDKAHPELHTDLDGLIKEILRSNND
jgi:hypothetical protein